ncbi:MAG: dihydrofolate reductase family protein [Chloroflexota bacterium]
MRKIIFLIHVTLDGYVAGTNGEMDWIEYNDEVAAHSEAFHAITDTAIYGRKTFEMMKGYWTTVSDNPNADEYDKKHATWLQSASKIAVSTTMQVDDWANIIIGDDLQDRFTALKQQDGKDMWLLGSPTLAQSMMRLNLIDEYRILVNPVILGSGQRLFAEMEHQLDLRLIEPKTFSGGVVLLCYVPDDDE